MGRVQRNGLDQRPNGSDLRFVSTKTLIVFFVGGDGSQCIPGIRAPPSSSCGTKKRGKKLSDLQRSLVVEEKSGNLQTQVAKQIKKGRNISGRGDLRRVKERTSVDDFKHL